MESLLKPKAPPSESVVLISSGNMEGSAGGGQVVGEVDPHDFPNVGAQDEWLEWLRAGEHGVFILGEYVHSSVGDLEILGKIYLLFDCDNVEGAHRHVVWQPVAVLFKLYLETSDIIRLRCCRWAPAGLGQLRETRAGGRARGNKRWQASLQRIMDTEQSQAPSVIFSCMPFM